MVIDAGEEGKNKKRNQYRNVKIMAHIKTCLARWTLARGRLLQKRESTGVRRAASDVTRC